ncbi:MAG TPA: hypothetical protein VMM13_16170, partial [Euzebya sp.]|nr:hypothetical protein [Euzebya sp.]
MQFTPRLSPLIAALAVLIVACGQATATIGVPTATAGGQPPEVTATPSVQAEASPSASIPTGDVLAVREVARRPHDATAFTQGLEF